MALDHAREHIVVRNAKDFDVSYVMINAVSQAQFTKHQHDQHPREKNPPSMFYTRIQQYHWRPMTPGVQRHFMSRDRPEVLYSDTLSTRRSSQIKEHSKEILPARGHVTYIYDLPTEQPDLKGSHQNLSLNLGPYDPRLKFSTRTLGSRKEPRTRKTCTITGTWKSTGNTSHMPPPTTTPLLINHPDSLLHSNLLQN
ncbi:hypothetical protein E4U39_004017 [Claviceps sp. Clav50 group G5]|nr:hypothetical protein E4U39_004017 [Claviceps sp. Clav50 group G5]